MFNQQNFSWTDDFQSLEMIPEEVLYWLIDSNSLTQKLKSKFKDFSVEIINNKTRCATDNESTLIGESKKILERNVTLNGCGKKLVYAQSLIPICKEFDKLLSIGSKPLGEILFNDKKIKRCQFEIAFFEGIWARRSIFISKHKRILVSEFFLDDLYEG